MTATAQVHDRLATLADPTRGRILLALEQHELTVGELCSVLSLPTVHGEPTPAGARRRRVGEDPARRHESLLREERRTRCRRRTTLVGGRRGPAWGRDEQAGHGAPARSGRSAPRQVT